MPKLKKSGTIHATITGYDFTKDDPVRPLKAIRLKCLECQGGSPGEVRTCHISDCTLWPYRFGTRPKPARATGVTDNRAVSHLNGVHRENLTAEAVFDSGGPLDG